jgi:CrcB protein
MLLIALAGALGTLSRYSIAGVVQRLSGAGFPWGTMVVNLMGCFLFGVVWALFEGKVVSSEARMIILAGFLGAFTTFSSFVFETGELLRNSQIAFASLNLLAQNAVGLVVFFTGLFLGRFISLS